jgi:hypothetical protein
MNMDIMNTTKNLLIMTLALALNAPWRPTPAKDQPTNRERRT